MSRRSTQRCPDFAAILRRTPPDEALREQVARCFYEEMRRLALHQCKDAVLAEDVVQDALINGLDALGSFRGDGALESWLRRLVHSACARMRRGRRNDPAFNQALTREPAEPVPAAADGPQALAVLARERMEILTEALAEVSEPNRSLFLLHEGREMPLAELAQRYLLSVDGVKARLKRTRATLRERLLAKAEELI